MAEERYSPFQLISDGNMVPERENLRMSMRIDLGLEFLSASSRLNFWLHDKIYCQRASAREREGGRMLVPEKATQ